MLPDAGGSGIIERAADGRLSKLTFAFLNSGVDKEARDMHEVSLWSSSGSLCWSMEWKWLESWVFALDRAAVVIALAGGARDRGRIAHLLPKLGPVPMALLVYTGTCGNVEMHPKSVNTQGGAVAIARRGGRRSLKEQGG